MRVILGQNNLGKAALDTVAKTITITGLSGYDFYANALATVYNNTQAAKLTLGLNITAVSNTITATGLSQAVYTFGTIPGGWANTDNLTIELNIPVAYAQLLLQQYNIVANVDTGAIVTLAASGTNGVSADQVNLAGCGLQLITDVTALGGTAPTITVTIQGKDSASGKYYNILTSAAISTVSTNQLIIFPGATVTANVSSSQPLPRTWRVSYTIAGTAPTITCTIGASVIV